MTRRHSPSGRPTTPDAEGFRMPAEWEPHRATWLVWPHNRADWGVKTSAVEWCYVEMVRHLTGGERVGIVCQSDAVARRAETRLRRGGVDLSAVDRWVAATNRSWIRDSGPIFVTRRTDGDREVAATDWRFTGWARYRACDRDDALPLRLSRHLGMRRFDATVRIGGRRRRMVLEGGSIDVNGAGLLLTTEACLLGDVQKRNPGATRDDLQEALRSHLGVRRVLWLGEGIVGDDTHGHVDDVARFVASDTIVAASEPDTADTNHAPLADNLARLRTMRDLGGRPLRVVALPMPRPIRFDGVRLPASYLNFYIANRSVLVPTFNDPADRIALGRLGALFPDRQVIGLHAVDLILGLGAIHCVTQQEPASAAPAITGERSPAEGRGGSEHGSGGVQALTRSVS